MQNKLQELTDKLYAEGLSKGKAEGEQIVADARKQAEEIIAKAREEAAAIVAQAERESGDLKTKVEGDLRMASSQCLQATRKDIENLLVGKMTFAGVDEALASPEFIKEIIKAVALRFDAGESAELELVLPESLKASLEPFVSKELSAILGKGVEAGFSKKIAGGFNIGPKDGGWFISFTDETFKALIGEYLRPVTRKLIFG